MVLKQWWGALLALGFLFCSANARADAMCGGPKRRPDPAPPAPSSSGPFAQPPVGAVAPSSGDRVAGRPPMLPVELGMLGCMVILGGAASAASRGKREE
jgi:hypothetical protein